MRRATQPDGCPDSLAAGAHRRADPVRMLPAASPFAGPPGRYVRHRPETTLLYGLVADHWPALRAELDAADRPLPALVAREFDAFLTCGLPGPRRAARALWCLPGELALG